jgi:hypothetical protein
MKIRSELIKATVVVALAVLLINGSLASSPIRARRPASLEPRLLAGGRTNLLLEDLVTVRQLG